MFVFRFAENLGRTISWPVLVGTKSTFCFFSSLSRIRLITCVVFDSNPMGVWTRGMGFGISLLSSSLDLRVILYWRGMQEHGLLGLIACADYWSNEEELLVSPAVEGLLRFLTLTIFTSVDDSLYSTLTAVSSSIVRFSSVFSSSAFMDGFRAIDTFVRSAALSAECVCLDKWPGKDRLIFFFTMWEST